MTIELTAAQRSELRRAIGRLDGTSDLTPALTELYLKLAPGPEQAGRAALPAESNRLRAAAILAIDRFDRNERYPSESGWMWKGCAWAMADDLRRSL